MLLAALFFSVSLSAQITSLQKSAPPVDIFTPGLTKSVASQAISKELGTFSSLETDPEVFAALVDAAPDEWTLNIPATSVAPEGLSLRLRRNDFIRPDMRVRLSSTGGYLKSINVGNHYVGEVVGEPGSRVAFSLIDGEMMGSIDRPLGDRLSIGKVENYTKSVTDADAYIIFPDHQLAERQELDCGTPDNGGDYSQKELNFDATQKNSVGCVDIYLEIDNDIVRNKGSVEAATQYVTGMFNQVAILYDNANIDLYISEMYAWDSPSPYGGATSIDYLFGFQAFRTSFNGDLAQLVSYGASGGVAVLNGLCHFRTSNKMSFSSIHSNYANVPTYSWSVMVMAHEIGHQLGSQHTHACVWNGNNTAIDGCAGGTQGNCPNPGYPAGGGTIMSYCHLRPNIGINFNLGFGPQPTSIMQSRVAASQACLANNCADRDTGGGGDDDDNGGGNDDDNDAGGGGDPGCIGGRNVEFRMTPDNFGMETTWQITTLNGLVVTSGGPYEKKLSGQTFVRRNICLPDGCYKLLVFDEDGDGICCEFGNGMYELLNSDGEVLATSMDINDDFDFESEHDFCVDASGGGNGGGGDDNDVDCPGIDFTINVPQSYGTNQDAGTVETQDTGSTIYLENNAWKAIDFEYNITANTWISFWFKSDRQGEVHGLGFDNNQVISSSFTFRVHGNQTWGISDFNTYESEGDWQYFEIPVGQYYTGLAQYLFFTADHDSGSRNGNSWFRSVTVSEGGACNNARSLTEGLPETEADLLENRLNLAPNPADEEIRVSIPNLIEETAYRILDINGRTVLDGRIGFNGTRISVRHLPAGTYIIRTEGKDGQTRRFTVTH